MMWKWFGMGSHTTPFWLSYFLGSSSYKYVSSFATIWLGLKRATDLNEHSESKRFGKRQIFSNHVAKLPGSFVLLDPTTHPKLSGLVVQRLNQERWLPGRCKGVTNADKSLQNQRSGLIQQQDCLRFLLHVFKCDTFRCMIECQKCKTQSTISANNCNKIGWHCHHCTPANAASTSS